MQPAAATSAAEVRSSTGRKRREGVIRMEEIEIRELDDVETTTSCANTN
jgi:hypothetical protein